MSARASLVDVFPLECRGNVKDPIHFNITFEVYEDLPEEFGFEVVMAWDGQHEHDQVLDSIEVGPVKTGKHNFILDTANVPDYTKVKSEDVTDMSVLFVHASYRGNRFANVSFFVSYEYSEENLRINPPDVPVLEKLNRAISMDDVRVTTFPIQWYETDNLGPPEEEDTEKKPEADTLIPGDDLPIAI